MSPDARVIVAITNGEAFIGAMPARADGAEGQSHTSTRGFLERPVSTTAGWGAHPGQQYRDGSPHATGAERPATVQQSFGGNCAHVMRRQPLRLRPHG